MLHIFGGGKPEHPERTHTDTRRTCKEKGPAPATNPPAPQLAGGFGLSLNAQYVNSATKGSLTFSEVIATSNWLATASRKRTVNL